jgi:uncharacterized protein
VNVFTSSLFRVYSAPGSGAHAARHHPGTTRPARVSRAGFTTLSRVNESGLAPSDPISTDPAAHGMTAHPEGGWYRETWRAQRSISTDRGDRALATSVAFLLRAGERSAWHRVAAEELWLWQGGGPVRITLGGAGAKPVAGDIVILGPGDQHLIPAGVWQSAEPSGSRATLVACIVSPGFDFADFSLAD